MDVVITVCDNAAGELCPIWPGHPVRVHWGIEDPAAVGGSRDEQVTAFANAARYLRNCITLLVALPLQRMESENVKTVLQTIGEGDGASVGVVGSCETRFNAMERQ